MSSLISPCPVVMGPPVATEILTAGGVHALALLAGGSDDRKQRVAAANSLYFMGWLTEQIRWAPGRRVGNGKVVTGW